VRSWDRHQIPKPGAEVAIAIGDAIDVPPGADERSIEEYRQALECSLARLERQAIEMLKIVS
jgi:lysophospholipid acyltransferase (LPLAT)-like uncharacterized protein